MFITLAIGTLGGAIAFLLHLPIPWLLGSLISVSTAQFCGLSLKRPHRMLDRAMRVLIGVSLGGYVASNISDFSVPLFLTILVSIVFVTLISAFGTRYFSRLEGFKPVDGFMSSLPGGLSFLIALSGDLGKNFPRIALIHTVRVVVLVATFSLLALFLDADKPISSFSSIFSLDLHQFSWELCVLILVSAFIAEKSHIAGSHVLFGLLLSTLAYKMGWVNVPMPDMVKVIAMIVFGSLLGYELSRKPDRSYLKASYSSIVFTLFVMLSGFIIALAIAKVFDQHYLLFLLAFAPGGIAEISLIALALGFDVGFVATVHACRFAFIMLVGPIGLNMSLKDKMESDKSN